MVRLRPARLATNALRVGEGGAGAWRGFDQETEAQVPKSSINDLLERCEGIAAHEETNGRGLFCFQLETKRTPTTLGGTPMIIF